ncbi:MAG TPA: hypothetical protein VHO69_14155 [Phototrophicaceae bacterium]|nr:hypothetical protein [Phototrophicaceae bacterium]
MPWIFCGIDPFDWRWRASVPVCTFCRMLGRPDLPVFGLPWNQPAHDLVADLLVLRAAD